MCKGYKKTCWIPSEKDLCGTCQNAKLADNFTSGKVERTPETLKFLRGNFDNIAYSLYSQRKHRDFLTKFQDIFEYRIYTHNETKLCPVYGWYLRNSEDSPMPNCLRCLAHALRYAKDKYVQTTILRSVVMRYDGPNMQSIIQRAKNAKSPSLYEFGTALLEVQGIYGVFDTFIELIDVPLAVKIQGHPLLHKMLMEDELLKLRVYRTFKARKCKFYEELYAKAWHPSRFMQWCLDEGEKSMDIPQYLFQRIGSPWNIEWS
jgi:hypothetical protein